MRYCSSCSVVPTLTLCIRVQKQRIHRGFNIFGQGQIRIKVVCNVTDTNTSCLVEAIDIINIIAR
jgi:hypothetical protein